MFCNTIKRSTEYHRHVTPVVQVKYRAIKIHFHFENKSVVLYYYIYFVNDTFFRLCMGRSYLLFVICM